MASGDRSFSTEDLGAWLVKVDPATTPLGALADDCYRDLRRRCVRRSYRTSLMEAGQPALLWVSGRDPRFPAGIHAHGSLTGAPEQAAGGAERRLEVPLALEPIDPPVLRAELLTHPLLGRTEVLRMPAGNNPSYLTRAELDALRELAGQVLTGP